MIVKFIFDCLIIVVCFVFVVDWLCVQVLVGVDFISDMCKFKIGDVFVVYVFGNVCQCGDGCLYIL